MMVRSLSVLGSILTVVFVTKDLEVYVDSTKPKGMASAVEKRLKLKAVLMLEKQFEEQDGI